MKKIMFLLLLACFCVHAQDKKKDKILAEAKRLYTSERASWQGTDIFLQQFPEKGKRAGGYFSYTEGNNHKCLFFSRDTVPVVLTTITFDDTFVNEIAVKDTVTRQFTPLEQDLYTIRQKALNEMAKDTLFKFYKNTSPNLIPLISNKEKKVYILTGPSDSGVVIFGNDYLLTFDKKNNITSKKALHRNIIIINYDNSDDSVGFHTHTEETGDLITATDLCTLMLYCPYTNWKQHYVLSEKKVSIWDCATNDLIIMDRNAWDKIAEDGKNK